MRRWLLALVISVVPFVTGASRPLDLPSGGPGVEQEEDAPEVIHFYNGIYEGDGFFFLLDISGSMYGQKIEDLKIEMNSAIDSLSPRSEFAIVSFSDLIRYFQPKPIRATRKWKPRAKIWVHNLRAFGPTKMLDAALELLRIARMSRQASRTIIAVGDGAPSSPSPDATLMGILSANNESLPWNTILIEDPEQRLSGARAFMSSLADRTGGEYRVVGE